MKKRLIVPVAAIAIFGLMSVFATSAMAHVSQTGQCSNCHDPAAAVNVGATLVSNDGVNAVYSISVNNPYGSNGWAVFRGATKVTGASGGGTSISVPVGITYTVFGVSVGSGNGYKSMTFAPAGATPPVTPPTAGTGGGTGTGAGTTLGSNTVRYRFKLGRRGRKGLTAVLTNRATGAAYTANLDKRGRVVFSSIPDGTYRLTVKVSGKKFKFKARTLVVGAHHGDED